MSSLPEMIREEVRREGSISCHRFMEMALYTPNLGYYERPQQAIGRGGDFFTSVSVGPLFGQMLAFELARWLAQFSPGPLCLVEAGAHQGDLARDILQALADSAPALAQRCEYWIVEPSQQRRIWQQQTLHPWAPRVRWFKHWREMPLRSVRGVILANELLDALPVHRLGWEGRQHDWFQWMIGLDRERLVWKQGTLLPEPLRHELSLAGLSVPRLMQQALPPNFTIELCPEARHWWETAAARLDQGLLLTLDYGLRAEAWLSPSRPDGTLRAYRRHQPVRELLADPGEQDLTAHVNWTQLERAGVKAGLTQALDCAQETFLVRIFEQAWNQGASWLHESGHWKRAFQTLTHPGHLGRAFRVFAQHRHAPWTASAQDGGGPS